VLGCQSGAESLVVCRLAAHAAAEGGGGGRRRGLRLDSACICMADPCSLDPPPGSTFAGNAFHPPPRHRQGRLVLGFGLVLLTARAVTRRKVSTWETEHATPRDQSRTSVDRCSNSVAQGRYDNRASRAAPIGNVLHFVSLPPNRASKSFSEAPNRGPQATSSDFIRFPVPNVGPPTLNFRNVLHVVFLAMSAVRKRSSSVCCHTGSSSAPGREVFCAVCVCGVHTADAAAGWSVTGVLLSSVDAQGAPVGGVGAAGEAGPPELLKPAMCWPTAAKVKAAAGRGRSVADPRILSWGSETDCDLKHSIGLKRQ